LQAQRLSYNKYPFAKIRDSPHRPLSFGFILSLVSGFFNRSSLPFKKYHQIICKTPEKFGRNMHGNPIENS
jgi:hypothetical protein